MTDDVDEAGCVDVMAAIDCTSRTLRDEKLDGGEESTTG